MHEAPFLHKDDAGEVIDDLHGGVGTKAGIGHFSYGFYCQFPDVRMLRQATHPYFDLLPALNGLELLLVQSDLSKHRLEVRLLGGRRVLARKLQPQLFEAGIKICLCQTRNKRFEFRRVGALDLYHSMSPQMARDLRSAGHICMSIQHQPEMAKNMLRMAACA
jgi:hypothetical protein